MSRLLAWLWIVPFLAIVAAASATTPWQSKIDPSVLVAAEAGQTVEALVYLAEQADLTSAKELISKEKKGHFVFERLRATAAQSQVSLIQLLREEGVVHQSFWIANMIWIEADLDLVQRLAERGDVCHLYANPTVPLRLPAAEETPPPLFAPAAVEWNIALIGAPNFWFAGFSGQGIVIAGQDTGYDWDHPALIDKYRGWNGVTADHDYNWHDAIHSGGGSCGANSPEPCDDHSHGTHTMGTMVGDDGLGNQIGVAPGALWMGCRNMNQGNGTPATYSECFEFFLAPTRVDGSDPDPSRAPHVINNSWLCPPSEGCADPTVLQSVVENTRAAGIVVVVSAGNDGSGCSSIDYPAAIYDAALTVGATDAGDSIAGFSSRGGVTVDGSLRVKPNVTAPGVGIRSSLYGGGFFSLSGTSMAGPHVAGQVALLISAVPALAGRVETLEACIEATAIPLTSTQDCSGIDGSQVPNNVYGRGRINLSLPMPFECSELFVFADDFDTGTAEGWR